MCTSTPPANDRRGNNTPSDCAPIEREATHQGFDARIGCGYGVTGQMGEARGGENALVTQNLLHFKQANHGFNQMSDSA